MIDAHHLLDSELNGLTDLLASWQAQWPEMGVLVLMPEAEMATLPALQAACRDARVPMVGAMFPALISNETFLADGIWLLRFNVMPPHFLLADMKCTEDKVAIALTALVKHSVTGTHQGIPTLFLIFDAMLPNIASVLTKVYSHLRNKVSYAGVNAGSETFQPTPCLFDQDRLIGDGVLGLLLPAPTRVLVRHGYPVSKRLMTASSTVGNRIDRIDGRPAFEVYREVIKAEFGVEVTHQNFYDYAAHYPFGLVTTIDILVRIPVAFNDDGSVFCVGEVPALSHLWLLRAPALDKSDCVNSLASALSQWQHAAPRTAALMTFYCAGRRMHFGADAHSELQHLLVQTGSAAVLGALSLGEIDTDPEIGFPRFHNATLVCVA